MSIYLGSAPFEEECAQVGDDFFSSDARIELTAFLNQLKRTFVFHLEGIEVNYKKKRESHDFGSYSELVVEPSGTLRNQSASVAYAIENYVPAHWDLESMREIIQSTVRQHFVPEDLASSLSWMNKPVQSVDQGRRLLTLIRKQRAGEIVTESQIETACMTLGVQSTEADGGSLKPFLLVFDEAGDDGETLEFQCQAEDPEHAVEQVENAYPGCKVLMYFEQK